MDLAYKPYFCNGMLQAPLHAMKRLRARSDFAFDQVDEIHIGLSKMGFAICGNAEDLPRDLLDAQFNGRYSCGLMLVYGGAGSDEYLQQQQSGFADQEIATWMKKIEFSVDEEADRVFPHQFVASILVRRMDGSEERELVSAPGTSEAPLSDHELLAMWQSRFASGGYEHDVLALVETLESSGSSRNFVEEIDLSDAELKVKQ
jgi:2-methylcitrate dehydratase PrpD